MTMDDEIIWDPELDIIFIKKRVRFGAANQKAEQELVYDWIERDPARRMRKDKIDMMNRYARGEITEREYMEFLVYSGVYKMVEGTRLAPNKREEDKR